MIKKIIVGLTLAFSVIWNSAAAPQDTLRVLAIGNSFSRDAVEQNLHELAAEEADKVYHFLGYDGMIQYHTREGGHDIVAYDWEYYLDFADEKMR